MEEKPNYYAIIPAEVRYDPELRANEKLLYGEITALAQKTGECWASNNYFSELYNVKLNAIAVWIRHLKEKNYITIEYKYKGKEIQKRIIKIGGIQKDSTSYSKRYEGGIQKDIENNININNTSIKEKEQEEKEITIFEMIESEFGRTLSPTEYEYISKWEDNDLTRYAIKQAILNNAPRIKYIQAILDSYKSKNIKTVEDAKQNELKHKRKIIEPEWLDKKIEKEELTNEQQAILNRIREAHRKQETNEN